MCMGRFFRQGFEEAISLVASIAGLGLKGKSYHRTTARSADLRPVQFDVCQRGQATDCAPVRVNSGKHYTGDLISKSEREASADGVWTGGGS